MQQQMAMPAGAAAAAVPPAAGITTEQIQKVRFASLTLSLSLSISLGFLEKMAPLAIASAKDQIFFVPGWTSIEPFCSCLAFNQMGGGGD